MTQSDPSKEPPAHESPRPSRARLAGLLMLALVPPFVARAAGSPVGAFTMFSRLEGYHLDVSVEGSSGPERVALTDLAPHLSAAARQVILPARGRALGADQVALLAGGLDDLGALLCALRPSAARARVTLTRGSPSWVNLHREEVVVACGGRR